MTVSTKEPGLAGLEITTICSQPLQMTNNAEIEKQFPGKDPAQAAARKIWAKDEVKDKTGNPL